MWWGHACGFGFFPFVFPFGLFFLIAIGFIVARVIFFRRFRRFGGGCSEGMSGSWDQRRDANGILKRRLANGDITEDEYNHIRDVLKD